MPSSHIKNYIHTYAIYVILCIVQYVQGIGYNVIVTRIKYHLCNPVVAELGIIWCVHTHHAAWPQRRRLWGCPSGALPSLLAGGQPHFWSLLQQGLLGLWVVSVDACVMVDPGVTETSANFSSLMCVRRQGNTPRFNEKVGDYERRHGRVVEQRSYVCDSYVKQDVISSCFDPKRTFSSCQMNKTKSFRRQ